MLISKTIMAIFLALGSTPTDDGPRTAIEQYFAAHALGNSEFIRQAFASDAKVGFVDGDQERQWTLDEFAKRFQKPAVDEYRRIRKIESLSVSGSAASAVLTLNYPDVLFTDHMSLLKASGQWKIVNKVFSANRRNVGQEAIDETLRTRSLPFEPRRIIGNIYYVGTNQISSFLIATSAGHILLDTGHIQMLPQVEANIARLGFKPKDVRILLNSHAHFDHCGGFAEFKRKTGATGVASRPDGELMSHGGKGDFAWGDDLAYEPVTPNRIVADGENIELGGVSLIAHLTPGHTRGCTSWSMKVSEVGKSYDVLFICGLTVSTYKLTNNERYPNIVEDERNSLKEIERHACRCDAGFPRFLFRS